MKKTAKPNIRKTVADLLAATPKKPRMKEFERIVSVPAWYPFNRVNLAVQACSDQHLMEMLQLIATELRDRCCGGRKEP